MFAIKPQSETDNRTVFVVFFETISGETFSVYYANDREQAERIRKALDNALTSEVKHGGWIG